MYSEEQHGVVEELSGREHALGEGSWVGHGHGEEVIEEGVAEEAVVREEVAREAAAWAGLAPLKVVLGRRAGRAVRTPSFLKLPWSSEESRAALFL